jgi:hypothetical protein
MNDWLFENIDPTVQGCKAKFLGEFRLLLHRAKKNNTSLQYSNGQITFM